MNIRSLAGVAAGLLVIAAPAFAHHSFAMFDRSKEVKLDGTIKEFKWSNPHSWIEMLVPAPSGDPVTWKIEMTAPNNLIMAGWKRTSLNPGDKVTLYVYPMKDGSAGGSFVRVQFADGHVLTSAAAQR